MQDLYRATNAAVAFSVVLLGSALCAQDYTLQESPPPGAPTGTCIVMPDPDTSKLLVLTGTAPVTFVFACGYNRPAGQCAVMTMQPGRREMPATTRLATQGIEQNGWTCVAQGSVYGWIPSNRLAPLPSTPTVPLINWIGWWRSGHGSPGVKNDRLLIQAGKPPGTLHVSGRAYWYGLKDNVHFGEVQADAAPYGDTLHVIEGDDEGACVIDLVYHPAAHTFNASDNMNCGGMNVRFSGAWQRFTPSETKPH